MHITITVNDLRGLTRDAEQPRDENGRFSSAGSAGSGSGHLVDKTGEKLRIEHEIWNGKHVYSVKNEEGRAVAQADLHRKKSTVSSINTQSDYRRRGIASQLYAHIEKHQGIKLQPNDLTPAGEAFWKSRKS